jgi:hypothetical protein
MSAFTSYDCLYLLSLSVRIHMYDVQDNMTICTAHSTELGTVLY